MKILLLGDGAHELEGALQQLVLRLFGNAPEIDFVPFRFSDRRVHINSMKGKRGGMKKRAIRWLLEAKDLECDAVIGIVDHDGFDDRIQQIHDAQSENGVDTPRAFGIAIRSFDAWIIADELALTQASEKTTPQSRSPESLRDPKSDCRKLMKIADKYERLQDFYAAVATHARPAVLSDRWERGFAPFAERVRQLQGALGAVGDGS